MTNAPRPYPALRGRRLAATVLGESIVLLVLLTLIGIVAVAELTGILDGLVHDISFIV